MTKILILSSSKENINKAKELLASEKYTLLTKEIPEKIPANHSLNNFLENKYLKEAKLVILDMAEQNTAGENLSQFFSNPDNNINTKKTLFNKKSTHAEILGILNKHDVAKLIILSLNQKEILFSVKLKFDDFLFYPQLQEELAVRINLILAKRKFLSPKNSIVVEELVLNLDKYELTVSGEPIELTFKEYELLKFLLQNQNKVFSRNRLLSTIWGYDFYGGSRTVDVHVRRLRSKIAPYDLMLKTIRNVGYIFSPKN